jgi:hypothetical protein
METTLTMAGQQAIAGAARLRAAAPGLIGSAVAAHPVSAGHQPTTWTKGALSFPTTSMVLEHKNRPTRLLPERSP